MKDQTNPNSQQSTKDRILIFFNKSGNANGDLDSKTIDGMTHVTWWGNGKAGTRKGKERC
jgi:hypothetical protein